MAHKHTWQEKNILRVFTRFFVLLFAFSYSSLSHALVTAEVLPKGVRAGAFVIGQGSVSHSLNEDGNRRSLVAPLNRSITLDDVIEGDQEVGPELETLRRVLNGMNAEQLGSHLLISNAYSDLEVTERRYVTGLLWGITEQLSVGMIVPVINRRSNVNFRIDNTDNAQTVLNRVGNIPLLREGVEEFIAAGIDEDLYVDRLFIQNGYERPSSSTFSALGDIEVESRMRYFQSTYFDAGMRFTTIFPTANHKVNLANLVDQPAGKEVFSFRLGSVNSFRAIPQVLSFHAGFFGTYNLPTNVLRALPKDPNAPLANLNDPEQIENVRLNRGASFKSDLGVMLDFYKGTASLMASYIYEVKAGDTVSGNNGLDYDRLMDGTNTSEHGMEFSFELSSVPSFMDDVALAPVKLSFTWYQPFKGRNVLYAPYGRIDAILLF